VCQANKLSARRFAKTRIDTILEGTEVAQLEQANRMKEGQTVEEDEVAR
jgi:hypothetical protein